MVLASGTEERAVTGRGGKMDRLYDEHAAEAMRLALLLTGDRHQAEDLVQDAFLRIFGSFAHVRVRTSFRGYLNRTIVNLSHDRGRRLRLERREIEREGRAIRPQDERQPDVAGREEMLDALRSLPHRQRAAIVLRYYQDLPEREVADALGCSLSAAKSLITRGMETLRAGMAPGRTGGAGR